MEIINKEIPVDFKEDIQKAVKILKEAGCYEIYIFGSLVKGKFTDSSDIDFAVKGLNPKVFFKVGGQLNMQLKHTFDLIRIDDVEDRFSNFIQEKEVFIRVA